MMTHNIDLNAIVERARRESYQAGYNAALQEVARFLNTNLGKSLDGFSMPGRAADDGPRLREGSLAALVLNKIEAHPDGIYSAEIKAWLQAGNSRYSSHPETPKRVDTALTRLKSHYGVIVKRDSGKWYRTSGSSDFYGQTA